jgi:hypothetical protein
MGNPPPAGVTITDPAEIWRTLTVWWRAATIFFSNAFVIATDTSLLTSRTVDCGTIQDHSSNTPQGIPQLRRHTLTHVKHGPSKTMRVDELCVSHAKPAPHTQRNIDGTTSYPLQVITAHCTVVLHDSFRLQTCLQGVDFCKKTQWQAKET